MVIQLVTQNRPRRKSPQVTRYAIHDWIPVAILP